MRIFLTGARGMVGRNFLEHPKSVDHEIISPSSKELNLSDYKEVRRALLEVEPDLVIHAAGRVGGIQANIREPVNFLLENLDMGRNIVVASHESGVKKLINLGSSCIYPREGLNPLKEELILQGGLEPTNEGYALAKIAVAKLCEYISRQYPEYRYKTILPCNLYGRHDKFDPLHSHMLPAIIHKLHQAKVSNATHVDIWGDGNARREFMYAGDLADCLWRAVNNFDDLPGLVNAGLGYDYTVNEYYALAAEVVGFSGEFHHDLSKPVGMSQKLVSIDLMKQWGWEAPTSLKQGLANTYKYYLEEVNA